MNFLQKFKAFAMRGNVVDMAVGIIIGAAFGKIVTSLVSDVIMPPIGVLIGGVDFKELKLNIKASMFDTSGKLITEPVTINYGNFIQASVDFIIVAFAIFLIVQVIDKLQKKEAETPATPAVSNEEKLLTEIRDLLKNKS
ncbi:MAG TPA: large-conductance mechanosensitive channel protein MscL [Cytophagaceae bacterium]|nr:large-conductance mechanosensitive channel protein MscL [Cytophagaceae bacterium]